MAITCPYCGADAARVAGDVIYPHRGDMAGKVFWRCTGCQDAWVGCHPGTDRPLGRLADAELRVAKRATHVVFDPLWRRTGNRKQRSRRRELAYDRLAHALGIPRADCHIGLFDIETCRRAVAACAELAKETDNAHA